MSSVFVYDKESKKVVSSLPDIYRRQNPRQSPVLSKKVVPKGMPEITKPKEALAVEEETFLQAKEGNRSDDLLLPYPFTSKRMEEMIAKSERLERLNAIDSRTETLEMGDQAPYHELEVELQKAFSSLEGLQAAFGEEALASAIEQ